MYTRHIFNIILTLSMVLGLSITVIAQSELIIPNEQELKKLSIKELTNQIRRDKYDLILPKVMREHGIDMWIHVMREGNVHSFGNFVNSGFYADLGSNSGVFIFTDRGGDRIERAALGRRWSSNDRSYPLPNPDPHTVEECGAYDIISEPIPRRETPGGPKTEYDYRFQGIGTFVAERDPKRIALNFKHKLGPIIRTPTNDGISHTDFLLLTEELGEKYAERLVSSELLIFDYLSRPVESELVMYKRIREEFEEAFKNDFAKIVPGVTKPSDLSTGYEGGLSIRKRYGERRSGDKVIQRGDFFMIDHGAEGDYDLRGVRDRWKYGNFFEMKVEYGYVLREGETEPPPEIKKLWSEGMKIRKVLDENIKVGRTAAETFEIIKRKLDEVGIIVNRAQRFDKDLDPEKTQVSIDLHGLGKGSYPPRIGSLGPDYQHEMTLQMYHHFAVEFFMYMPLTSTKDKEDYLRLWFHDGAHATENGVRYLTPPPSEIHLIK
jgi:hypothetical protein